MEPGAFSGTKLKPYKVQFTISSPQYWTEACGPGLDELLTFMTDNRNGLFMFVAGALLCVAEGHTRQHPRILVETNPGNYGWDFQARIAETDSPEAFLERLNASLPSGFIVCGVGEMPEQSHVDQELTVTSNQEPSRVAVDA